MYSTIGSTVNLSCNLNVDRMYVTWLGPPNLSVYATGNSVHEAKKLSIRVLGNEQEKQHILQIVKMNESNEGLYKCIATEGNKSFTLFIQTPFTLCSPKHMYTTIGSTVNVTCNLNVDRMYVTWLGPPNQTVYAIGNSVHKAKNVNVRILGNAKENKHILQIVTMHETNEGLYKCIATEGNETFQLVIQRPPRNITIDESHNSVVYGVVNEKMNITCNVVTGKPAETMLWVYGHEVVAKGGPGSLKYTFTPDSTHNLQTFRCVAFNNITRTTLIEDVTLHVYSEPTVKIFPSGTIKIIEDESLLLECKYISNDNKSTLVNWNYTFDGYIKQTSNTVFKLDNIKRYHAGNYSCSVSNSVGTTEDTVTVNVLCLPYIPTINNRIKYEISGKETNLTLNVVSYPTIKTVMVFNNLSVRIKDVNYQTTVRPSKIEDLVYGTKVNVKGYKLCIQFKINLSDDFTMYTIMITNDYGVSNISVSIRSARPLRVPQNVKAVALDSRIIVKWTANRHIRQQEMFHVEYRKHSESSWSRVSAENRSTAIINGLQPNTAYFVRVYSKTAAGESDKTDVIIVKTVVKNKKWFLRDQDGIPPSRRNEETSVRLAHYDEIDSMYYNPLNITVSPQNDRNNAQLEILQPANTNADNCNTNNCSNNNITPAIIHHFNNSQENYSLRSSSDESYLVPCNFIDLDIEKVTENEQEVNSIKDPETLEEESSVSSDNSETNIKSIQRYEKLRLSDMNGQSNTEHMYNYIDT
ncbi:NCAM [Mytilus coruscus]|uniref:NCAM n=1 Tax=Mytilus coruscus TaxID=42192 RepID=A0A6J8AIX1_MYTCO|nr:NCAM [Mytilus coruscus]